MIVEGYPTVLDGSEFRALCHRSAPRTLPMASIHHWAFITAMTFLPSGSLVYCQFPTSPIEIHPPKHHSYDYDIQHFSNMATSVELRTSGVRYEDGPWRASQFTQNSRWGKLRRRHEQDLKLSYSPDQD